MAATLSQGASLTAETRPAQGVSRPRRITIPPGMIPGVRDFPALDGRLWWLALARLTVNAGFAAVMPFLAMHLVVERGFSLLRVGGMWMAVGLTGAAASWVAGAVTERLGRRRVLVLAMVLRSLNLALLGYAVSARAPFGAIVALCLINGSMRAFYDPAASAVVASLCHKDERVAAFALHRVGGSLGWTLGPLAATFATDLSYGTLFYVSAPLTLLGAFAAASVPDGRVERDRPARRLGDLEPAPETGPSQAERGGLAARRDDRAYPSVCKGGATKRPGPAAGRATGGFRGWLLLAFRRDPAFVRFLVATFAFFVLQTQMYHIMAIYAAQHLGLGRSQVGALFVVNGILVVIVQLPIVRLIARIGTARALVLGSLGYLIAYTACGFAVGFLTLLGCVAVATLCEIVAAPAHQARVTALAPPDKVAGYAGVAGLAQGLATTFGPALGGALLSVGSPRLGWSAIGAVGLLAAALFARRRSSA